jgi:uncharacterized damage-inducible protein DinB
MSTDSAVTSDSFLAHWQGHRRLTRHTIDSFPEDQLFTFTLGGMRSFGELVLEMLTMAEPMLRGVVTGEWEALSNRDAVPKDELLRRWDESTAQIDALWPRIPAGRFQETLLAVGLYEDLACNLLLYVVDNEIHHRGQGYVYLRALGVEPPPFYVRT